MAMQRVGVLGSGAWGTALAIAARRAGRDVTLWARRREIAEAIDGTGENRSYLPGVAIDPAIRATSDLAEAAANDALLLVVPAQHLRGIAQQLAPHLSDACPVIICAKGIERGSGALMSEVVEASLPGRPQAVLSGPTFAAEVGAGLPTAVTLASHDADLGARLLAVLGSRSFRPYLSGDPIGAEVGGAVKNVLAIACGIIAGRKLGDNARAALITRGLAEIARLARAKGGLAETLMGLSGLGDLTLTCSAMQSRNFSFGVALGEGQDADSVLAKRSSVAEGVPSSAAVAALASAEGIEMPISQAVDAVLNRGADIDRTIENLLSRPFTSEWS